MIDITFVTGNQSKADYLAKFLGYPVKHAKIELDEIQSLDLHKVVERKVREAYGEIQGPVLVEDVSLEFEALGRLPGAFIKFYVDEIPLETICRTLDGLSRSATARCVFGYYDGRELKFFEGKLNGSIAEQPDGDNGFGWDRIFIPDGYEVTRAALNQTDDRSTYLQIKPFEQLKTYLEKRSSRADR